ncbi:MAG TPA: hypothetical protein VK157_17480 [Phycisphaerales bacterium]|nr:hypothetical protein [Phycisphaerales bacterium]
MLLRLDEGIDVGVVDVAVAVHVLVPASNFRDQGIDDETQIVVREDAVEVGVAVRAVW